MRIPSTSYNLKHFSASHKETILTWLTKHHTTRFSEHSSLETKLSCVWRPYKSIIWQLSFLFQGKCLKYYGQKSTFEVKWNIFIIKSETTKLTTCKYKFLSLKITIDWIPSEDQAETMLVSPHHTQVRTPGQCYTFATLLEPPTPTLNYSQVFHHYLTPKFQSVFIFIPINPYKCLGTQARSLRSPQCTSIQ